MKIAIVRGAFANPAELQNFEPLLKKHEVVVFGSKNTEGDRLPRRKLLAMTISGIPLTRLFSPYDIIGKNRYLRGIFNRLFVDSHYLFGLEEKLKGFDIAICAETYYGYTQQCLNVKKQGYIKKVFSTVWENIPFNNESLRGRKAFKKRAFVKVDLFLAVTNQAKETLITEGCFSPKITVLNPGVNLKVFQPASKKSNKIRILVVSRNVPEKGINQIENIFRKIKKNNPQVELTMAHGKISYKNMPAFYQSGDIFLHYPVGNSTWREQYGMALIEAMGCGLAVVAMDNGAVKEVVGSGGLVCSPAMLEKNLQNLITDSSFRLRQQKIARAYACKNYSHLEFSEKLAKIII